MLRQATLNKEGTTRQRAIEQTTRFAGNIGLLLAGIATTLAVGALVLITVDTPDRIFRSPDENANYIFTKTLAETGGLSYDADYLANDPENLLHPRGILTHEGKAVPFNFFGLPVLYAPFYKLVGDDLKYIALPLALIAVFALAGAGARLVPDRPWIAWLAVLSAAPLINAFTRPYLNLLPALMFGSIAAYFLIAYVQKHSSARSDLILSSAAFALAAFVRYELALFAALLMIVAILHKQGAPGKPALTDFSIFLGLMAVLFVAPVLALNQYTYGSPLTYGYSLFNDAYFPARTDSGAFPLSLLSQVRSVLLPAYPFSFEIAAKSLTFHVFGVAPLFAMAAAAGALLLVRRKAISGTLLCSSLVLAAYVYLYRGAGESNLAGETAANWEASVIRYSIPLFVAFFFLIVYAVAQIRDFEMTLLVLGMLAFSSFASLTYSTAGNGIFLRDRLHDSEEFVARTLPHIEQQGIVYTDIFDKVLSDQRIIASWWGGAEAAGLGEHFDAVEVGNSMRRQMEERPVYLLVSGPDDIVPALNSELEQHDFMLNQIEGRLFQLTRVALTVSPAKSRAVVGERTYFTASFFTVTPPTGSTRNDLVIANTYEESAGGCWLVFRTDKNRFYLRTTDGLYIEAGAPGDSFFAENEKCILDAAKSTVEIQPEGPIVNFAVTFKESLTGSYGLFMRVQNLESGEWMAPGKRGEVDVVRP